MKHIAPQKKTSSGILRAPRSFIAYDVAKRVCKMVATRRVSQRILFGHRLASERMPAKPLTVVTGGRGEGKTTFVQACTDHLSREGRSFGGILSPAVFENEQRIGYDLIDLCRGVRREFARVNDASDAGPTVGRFQLSGMAIAEGNAAIISAVRDNLDVVAIDEVGRLEFRGEGWAPALRVALDECDAGQQLILAVRRTFVDELRRCFPSPLWPGAVIVQPPWPSLAGDSTYLESLTSRRAREEPKHGVDSTP
jgi:nucleoside-triphosphatase